MGSPYQPYYQPSPYQMAPPPMNSTPYSAVGRRDQFDESEMMLAIQRSIEEEDRRKQQVRRSFDHLSWHRFICIDCCR